MQADRRDTRGADREALAIVAEFCVARLLFAYGLGLGADESYTLAISRTLALSYFDHPPLHQWIAHFADLAFGEGTPARWPFILMFAATGWLAYRLTRKLFGALAALVALFALNVTPFFFASAGAWVVPDGPLLLALAGAALALAEPFLSRSSRKSVALAPMAARRRGLRARRFVQIQRGPERSRRRGVCRARAEPAALAPASCALRGGRARARADHAGHRLERVARMGVVRLSGRAGARRVRA